MGLLKKWAKQFASPRMPDPDEVQRLIRAGNALLAEGRLEAAAASYKEAIQMDATNAAARINLGFLLREMGDLAGAQAQLELAARIEPESADARYLLGLIAEAQGDAEAASKYLAAAVEVKPDFGPAWYDLSRIHFEAGRLEAATRAAEQGLAAGGGTAELHNLLGNIYLQQGDYAQAVASYDQALRIAPDFYLAHGNRGLALHEMRCFTDALESYERALKLKPDYAEGHFNASLTMLLLGDFKHGWKEFEWRWQHKERKGGQEYSLPTRAFDRALWLGDSELRGKKLLLHHEQGLGDTIQFCRYAAAAAALGATVILEVPAALASLLKDLAGVAQLVCCGDKLPEFDLHCPLLSLPLAFKTEMPDVSGIPYLKAQSDSSSRWGCLVGERAKPRVGLVWSGSTEHKNDRNRSIPLAEFQQALPEGMDYICLQKEIRAGDREVLQHLPGIRTFQHELADFADTAGLIEQLDLVVTVDTSVAHLAGAMGKEVWILLPYMPDWRWLLDREDSPWYASAHLLRQPATGDWQSVLADVRERLRQRF